MKKSIAKHILESAEKSADTICGEPYEPDLDLHAVAILGASFGRALEEYASTIIDEEQEECVDSLLRLIGNKVKFNISGKEEEYNA